LLYIYLYRQVAKNRKTVEPISVAFMTFAFGSVALIATGFVVPGTISLEAFGDTNLLIFLGLVMLCTAIPSFALAFVSERLPSVVTAQFHSLFRCSLLPLRSCYSERRFRQHVSSSKQPS
jgi:hypothetical protein